MDTTPVFKWTTAQSSDRIADIATITSGGMDDIENSLFVPDDSKTADQPLSAYPLGMSLMKITTDGADSGGWPGNGMVQTLRRGKNGDVAYQLWMVASFTPQIRMRAGNGGKWSDWVQVAGASGGLPAAQAAGSIFIKPTPNEVTVGAVEFPDGRFTAAPRVMLTPVTSFPQAVDVASYNITTDGFDIELFRASDQSTQVQWYAIQT